METILKRKFEKIHISFLRGWSKLYVSWYLLIVLMMLSRRIMKRLESIAIAHLLLEQILDAEGNSDWLFIFDFKVKPLEMCHRVTIGLYE